MRIAIQDSWPNLKENAEKEFISRFLIACENIGAEAKRVVTSDDIVEFSPDLVVITHEFSRKLSDFPTVGLIWSPLSFFKNDPYRIRSLLSYDGYLAGNEQIRSYLEDLTCNLGIKKPISSDIFLPTTYTTDHFAADNENISFSYIGVHWDGPRHKDLFAQLAESKICTFYGPESSWQHLPHSYGGKIPFDGRSVQKTLASHGLALCLHKSEHLKENTPSMRIFEALSVGAIPVCDEIAFAKENCSEFAFFIDTTQTAENVAEQICNIQLYAKNNKQKIQEMARKGKTWFENTWSLEKKIQDVLLPLTEDVKKTGLFNKKKFPLFSLAERSSGIVKASSLALSALIAKASVTPKCEIIIRTGDRDIETLRRALYSVIDANSVDFPLGIIVVDYRHRQDVKDICERLSSSFLPIKYLESESNGFRSTALWDGLKAARAEFVAHLDDDDTIYRNHYRQLHATITQNPQSIVAYSGVVKREDDDGIYFDAPNFAGPLQAVIKERNDLQFLDHYDLSRLAKMDNFIQSNAWMARTADLQNIIGDDPKFVVVEDMYLYLLLSQRGPFTFTGGATAVWHWRSKKLDNSMNGVAQEIWANSISRLMTRLSGNNFINTLTLPRIIAAEDRSEVTQLHNKTFMEINQLIAGGISLFECCSFEGFYKPEIPGIWSKRTNAKINLHVAPKDLERVSKLRIEFMGSFSGNESRWVEIDIDGSEPVRVNIVDWTYRVVTLKVPKELDGRITVNVKSSHLVKVGEDVRELGVFVASMQLLTE